MLTREELREIAGAIRDLRFIQASAVVALGVKDGKKTSEYMGKLAYLQTRVDTEMLS